MRTNAGTTATKALAQARRILNGFPFACCELDSNDCLTYSNSGAQTLFGFGAGQLQGMRIAEVFPINVTAKGIRAITDALIGRVQCAHIYGCHLEDQQITLTIRYTENEGTVIVFNQSPKVSESQELLQSVFDTSLIRISILQAVYDHEGNISDFRIKLVNKELEKETGRTDLAGKLYSQEYPGIRQTGLYQLMLQVMETGEAGQIEYYYPHEGFNKWYSSMFVRMQGGLVATNLDITPLKLAEEKLREDALMVKSIADGSPDLLYVLDLKNQQMVYANGNFTRLIGRPLEALSAEGTLLFERIIHPQDLEKLKESVSWFSRAGKGIKELLIRLECADGSERCIKTRLSLHKQDEQGLALQVIGIGQDITEQLGVQESNRVLKQERRELEAGQTRALFRVTQQTQEEERRRIARHLQNNLGNLLYGLKLGLSSLKLDQGATAEGPKQKQYLQQLTEEAIRECRLIADELLPALLEHFGLEAAIKDTLRQYGSSLEISCNFSGPAQRLTRYFEITVYRLFQTLITCLVLHSGATRIRIQFTTGVSLVSLTVHDNGGWMDGPAESMQAGLLPVRDKVNLLKGKFSTSFKKGIGNMIHLQLPYLSA